MWQAHTLPDGDKIVSFEPSSGIKLMFNRRRDLPSLFITVYLDDTEPRVFDTTRLPLLTVDGEEVTDFNAIMGVQRLFDRSNEAKEVFCLAGDRMISGVIWNGTEMTPAASILKLIRGNTLKIQVFFKPFAVGEHNLPLTGLGDALHDAFGVPATSEMLASTAAMNETVSIDRALIRSTVEDHWRSFLSVAVDNPQIGMQSIERFDEQIQATALLMDASKSTMYLQIVRQEQDKLFKEYEKDPDALRRRLGLSSLTQPVIIRSQRQKFNPIFGISLKHQWFIVIVIVIVISSCIYRK